MSETLSNFFESKLKQDIELYKVPEKPLNEDSQEQVSEAVFQLFGKEYKTKVFKSIKDTNDFLEKHSDWGVIGEKGKEGDKGYEVHVAKNSDKGTKIKKVKNESQDLDEKANPYAEKEIKKVIKMPMITQMIKTTMEQRFNKELSGIEKSGSLKKWREDENISMDSVTSVLAQELKKEINKFLAPFIKMGN